MTHTMQQAMHQVRDQLAALVAEPSVSAVDPAHDMSNAGVVELLADWYGAAGFSIQRQAVSSQPAKSNLIARLGHGEGGLVLSGHTDTVPYDRGGWDSDPFALDEREGRWYGLGSADMKCFFPIILAALDGLDPTHLVRPVIVLATADEESSMNGARAITDEGVPIGRYAVIGEPTALVPVHKHKGIVIARVTVEGRSGHSSEPALGANALDCMHDIISDFKQWRAEAAERFTDADFKVPAPTLNLGTINGGDSPNRICARCELMFDVRVVPGLALSDVVGALSAFVKARGAEAGVEARLELPMAPVGALDTPADSAIVRAVEELSGNSPRTVAFATEGPFFNALGCESVVFGPGDIAVAHQPNEFVEVDKVESMIGIVRRLIERFCCNE